MREQRAYGKRRRCFGRTWCGIAIACCLVLWLSGSFRFVSWKTSLQSSAVSQTALVASLSTEFVSSPDSHLQTVAAATAAADRSNTTDPLYGNISAPIGLRRHGAIWKASHLYLPAPTGVRSAFFRHQDKQKLNDVSQQYQKQMTSSEKAVCFSNCPECMFFLEIRADLLLVKCCVEHQKLRQTLFFVADVAAAHHLHIFLMFGTLLSAIRDGGDSLIPWETDIDLGILGTDPFPFRHAIDAFLKDTYNTDETHRPRQHRYEVCKTSGNDNDMKRKGTCSDVHCVYWASSIETLSHDKTRVELWPYRSVRVATAALQERNERQLGKRHRNLTQLYTSRWGSQRPASIDAFETVRRSELVLPAEVLLPLTTTPQLIDQLEEHLIAQHNGVASAVQCRLWGRDFHCPSQSGLFLDLEYHGREGWWRPKTIHWGAGNVMPWRV